MMAGRKHGPAPHLDALGLAVLEVVRLVGDDHVELPRGRLLRDSGAHHCTLRPTAAILVSRSYDTMHTRPVRCCAEVITTLQPSREAAQQHTHCTSAAGRSSHLPISAAQVNRRLQRVSLPCSGDAAPGGTDDEQRPLVAEVQRDGQRLCGV